MRLLPKISMIAVPVVAIAAIVLLGANLQRPSKAASNGWLSGAGGSEAVDGSFANWRGEPVTISETWLDSPDLFTLQPGAVLGSWTKPLSVSLAPGTSWNGWASLAAGGQDAFWRQMAQNLKQLRAGRGTTYVSPFYEYNGDWMKYSVTRTPLGYADFKNGWARWSGIFRQEFPEAKIVLVPACSRDVPQEMMPAPSTYDLGGCTIYNEWPFEPSGASAMSRLETGRARAEAAGKPFGITEWSNAGRVRPQATTGGGGEAPDFISAIYNWMSAHAGTGPGQLVFETQFNIGGYNGSYEFCTGHNTATNPVECNPSTVQPQTAARYKSLNWGNGGTVTPSPSPVPPPSPAPTPPPATQQISQVNNLANGKSFVASVGDHASEPGNPPPYVNDKNESTRWISAPSDNVTLATDLGAGYTLNKVSILWAGDTVRNYDLQMSADNTAWTTIASGATNNTTPQLIDTTAFSATPTGRYFRVLAKDRWNASYGNSIYEIGLYGAPSPAPSPSPTPAPTPTPTPPPQTLPGDINNDGRVNALDLSILLSHDSQNYPPADLNRDGTVGAADAAILLAWWTW